MSRRLGPAIAATIVLSVLLWGCGGKPVVGVLLPTSGSASMYGESIASGVRLALSDVAQGKLKDEQLPAKFEVVWADSGSDPKRAVAELERLVRERKVRLVIGGATSGEAKALVPVLKDLNVVCLSPSASLPGLNQQTDMFFRLYPSDELEGVAAGRFLAERIKCLSAVVYTTESEYARGIEPEFRQQYLQLGGTVAERIDIDQPGWEARSSAALRRVGPSAVYVVGYAAEILGVVRHLRELAYPGQVVTTSAFDNSSVIQQAAGLAEYVMFPLPPFDRTLETGPVAAFVHRYEEAYQRAPDVLAAHGYDAMRLAIRAMTLAKPPEASKLKQVLHFEVSGFAGVTGAIQFNDYGEVRHNPIMFIVAKGQVMSYEKYLKLVLMGVLGDRVASSPTPSSPR